MKQFRLLTIVLCSTLFSGCASYGPRSQPFISEGKSLAYTVDLSDQLQLQWVGTTVFNNARAVQTADDWHVADHVAENVAAVLHDSTKFTQITRVKNLPEFGKGAPISGVNADFLLVIRAARSSEGAFDTNQGFIGIGLFQRSGFGMGPYSSVTVALEAELLDVHSGKSLRKTGASDLAGGGTLLHKSMHLNAEQLSTVKVLAASAANHVSTICLENLGLKEWVQPISSQGKIREIKF